ncbi:MAG: hypothetical protein H7A37_02100 [Chlamydiales bacterium]|nr:hypothetical protein [Chlamydiia bacterium]MCP5507083.1 hypothetical protein [Chlamydiales bacterium]
MAQQAMRAAPKSPVVNSTMGAAGRSFGNLAMKGAKEIGTHFATEITKDVVFESRTLSGQGFRQTAGKINSFGNPFFAAQMQRENTSTFNQFDFV